MNPYESLETELAAVEYAMSVAVFRLTWLKLNEIRNDLLGQIKELSRALGTGN